MQRNEYYIYIYIYSSKCGHTFFLQQYRISVINKHENRSMLVQHNINWNTTKVLLRQGTMRKWFEFHLGKSRALFYL